MTKTHIAKAVARFIVGFSAGHVTTSVLRNAVAPQTSIQKAEVIIGSFAIGGIVSDKAGAWTDEQIDSLVDGWKKAEKN